MSLTEDIAKRILAGETKIEEDVGPKFVARQMAADLRGWWERDHAPLGADSESAVLDRSVDVRGWHTGTLGTGPEWHVILRTVD